MSKKVKLTLGVFSLLIGCIGTTLLQSDSYASVLSDAEMGSFYGGKIIERGGGECSKCESSDCEDIECSLCYWWDGSQWCDVWVKGADGDTSDVTACYASSDGSSCTSGDSTENNCAADTWYSEGCSGPADWADSGIQGDSCS